MTSDSKFYLLRKALHVRRGLISKYRKSYKQAKKYELSKEKELFLSEFYFIEKQIILAIKQLDTPARVKLPCAVNLDGGKRSAVPRVFTLAKELALTKNGEPEGVGGAELSQRELSLLPECMRIALLERLDGMLESGSADEAELQSVIFALKRNEAADWDEIIEKESGILKELSVSESFLKLDKESRRLCVSSIERVSKRVKLTETETARRAVELASSNGRPVDFYLADGNRLYRALTNKGREQKPNRLLALFMLFTALITIACVLKTESFFALALSVYPALSIALSTASTVFGLLTRPRRVSRLEIDSAEGEYKTCVAMPVLLSDKRAAEDALAMLETHYIANPLEGAEFILLADLADAKAKTLETDGGILEAAESGVKRLNGKYGRHFHLLSRERSKNADGVYQGHERKRGAVIELCALLAGGENTFRERDVSLSAKYLVVLDADTVLPPDTLKKLIGAAANPINQPIIRDGKLVSGYSVFAPRMRTDAHSAAKSLFSRLFSGDVGYEIYSAAASNLHMDMYGEGDFGGKGVINVKAFLALTKGRIRDNTVLSHDLLEGSFAGTAYIDDVVLLDSEPSTLPKWWKRQERWIRGDWQLLPYILGKGLRLIPRFKMLANLFRSLREPSALVLITASLVSGSARLMALTLISFAFEPLKGFILLALASLRERSAKDGWLILILRTLVETAALPYSAYMSARAVLTSLWRILISHRNMLVWQTAAASNANEKQLGVINAAAALFVSVLSTAMLSLTGVRTAAYAALILSVEWLIFIPIIRTLDRESPYDSTTNAEKDFIRGLFLKAWMYFDKYVNAETNYLPPDNIQEEPKKPYKDLTSPTNIGMGLMAFVAAHDMGVISDGEFIVRTYKTLKTISKLEKYHGNLYNWYRITDASVIKPRFVSSVDSGNLKASLMVLTEALNETGAHDAAELSKKLSDETELSALYDSKNDLFYIGYDADEGRFTPSHYDLYASEARLLSFVAVAGREAPLKHWRALSRIMKDTSGGRTLLSWSGTAFEYLMPLIFMDAAKGSLQYETALSAIRTQILSTPDSIPWGTSESGCYSFDSDKNYAYRAFGDKALKLERSSAPYEVRAPYASALYMYLEPGAAIQNLMEYERLNAVGEYGMYEALDYGEGTKPRLVKSFMAHHKGMELCAYAAFLSGDRIRKRFMKIPAVRAYEQLLFEQLPLKPIIIREYESSVYMEFKGKTMDVTWNDGGVRLSNGTSYVQVFENGESCSGYDDVLITDRSGVQVLIKTDEGVFRIDDNACFEPHTASFERNIGELKITETIQCAPFLRAEIRKLGAVNRSKREINLTAGVLFRPVMVPEREYTAHPAFVKLSVDAKKRENAVLFRLRKKRNRRERWLYASLEGEETEYFTASKRLIPFEKMLDADLREFSSRPIEPVFCAIVKMRLKPDEVKNLTFILGAADSEDEAVKELKTVRDGSDGGALIKAVTGGLMRCCGLTPSVVRSTEGLCVNIAGRSIIKQNAARANGRGTAALWELGISGDIPIVLVSCERAEQLDRIRKFTAFTRFAHARKLRFDAVILSFLPTEYGSRDRTRLSDLVGRCPEIRIIDAALTAPELIEALKSMALICADAEDIPFYAVSSADNVDVPLVKTQPVKQRSTELWNGYGGFDTKNEEYVICTGAGPTPAPWCNILANESFGSLVTENGGGYTFCDNSRLLRLTEWSCDPLNDKAGERVTLTENGRTVNLMPYGRGGEYELSHGLGYTRSALLADGLRIEYTQFVDIEKPRKYHLVKIENTEDVERHITLRLDIDWVLGEEPHPEALVKREKDGIVFISSARWASDGREAYVVRPERSLLLEGKKVARTVFMMGMDRPQNAADINADEAAKELERVREGWQKRLTVINVRTGNKALDMLVDRLLLYQVYSSRLFAKTGFYQSGGAVGFRDRLQDSLALLITEPERAKSVILDSAAMQFEEGDVLHWRHPNGVGARTRISDDRLFLPYAVTEYVRVTGDGTIWDEEAPFLTGRPLDKDERDRCEVFRAGDKYASVFEHCVRAIKISMKTGKNGIPLMGTGDWNDGMDDVMGESAFTGWFLLYVIEGMKNELSKRGESKISAYSKKLRESMENTWEGDRYIRAVYPDGTKLGSKTSKECSIDLVSGVWAVLNGAEHSEEAFNTIMAELFDEKNGIIKLLAPPFTDSGERSAGYIESYVEGMRENGGQYTHAAAWAMIAACVLKKPDAAEKLFNCMDPILHGGALSINRYKTEPYAVAGDIGGAYENAGRGGWSFYTGSAAWLYRAALEYMLGFKKTGSFINIEPVTSLDSFEINYRFGSSVYSVKAERGETASGPIELLDDGKRHEIRYIYN